MISFYPGPSKLYPEIGNYMKDAVKEGVLSINHRSKEFTKISEKTIRLLKRKLNIPGDYTVFFTSSATESWEIIAQSLIEKNSVHFYNGAFGEKWFDYTKRIKPDAVAIEFEAEENLSVDNYSISEDTELICLVQNETSNATQVLPGILSSIREKYPKKLIAIDATSSMAGIVLPFKSADVWLASVQKCFGLPAGLGLLICSSNAIDRASEINENNHYNSLVFLEEKMKVWQTSHTPNVLLIYLLGKVLEQVPVISKVDKMIKNRAKEWYSFLSEIKECELLISNAEVRSETVIAVKGNEKLIAKLKEKAKKEGLLLGNGYGSWKNNTFRIANFPAILESDISKLKRFLKNNLK